MIHDLLPVHAELRDHGSIITTDPCRYCGNVGQSHRHMVVFMGTTGVMERAERSTTTERFAEIKQAKYAGYPWRTIAQMFGYKNAGSAQSSYQNMRRQNVERAWALLAAERDAEGSA